VYVYHNFLILSLVVGHLDCFQRLAIVHSTVMNIGVQFLYCMLFYVPLGRCSWVVSLDHMAVLSLVSWGISILLSIAVVLVCIPTSSYKDFCFTTSFPASVVVITFDYGHTHWVRWNLNVVLICVSYKQGSWMHLHVFTSNL
jgi:hypothetical protein